MSKWENYITAPIERFHSEAQDEFHNGAQFDVNEKIIDGIRYINGIEFNRLIVRFKAKIKKTYKIKSDPIYTSSPITSKQDRKIIEDAFYELMSKEQIGLKDSAPETYKKLKSDIQQLKQKNAKLKERLKEAKKEIDELYGGRLGACHTCEQVAEFNIKLEQQLKEAESVIEFYAKPGVWGVASPSDMTSIDPCDVVDFFHQEIGITSRGGKKAREYLAKHRGDK